LGIKLKNKYLNKAALILTVYLFGFSFILAIDFVGHTEYLKSDSYFGSSLFKNDLSSFFYNLKSFHIDYKDYEKKSNYDKLGIETINDIKTNYNSQLKEEQNKINNDYIYYIGNESKIKDNTVIKALTEERDKKLKKLEEEFSLKIDEEIKRQVADKDMEFNALKNSLFEREDIKYYIKNISTGEIYSNIKNITDISAYIKDKALYSIEFPRNLNFRDPFLSINNEFKSLNLEGYFIIPKEFNGYSQMIANYNYYNSIRERVIIEGALFVICIGVAILISLYLNKNNELFIEPINTFIKFLKIIPLDLRILIFIFLLTITLSYLSSISFFYFPINIDHFFKLTITSILTLYVLLSLLDYINLIKNKKEIKIEFKKSMLNKFVILLKESSANKSILFKVISIFIFTCLFCMSVAVFILGISGSSTEIVLISLICILAYIITIPYYVLKKVSVFNNIFEGSEEIVKGNLNYEIKTKGAGHLSRLANNINNMKEGYKKSLEEQIKSERLKSELITNVSHDLKTPLTSIVNYVDLLKKEDLSKEEIQGYVGILDRKTQRLKVLIEDLFEASKLASGSIKLNIEKVDVAAILRQTLGEFDEKIKASSLKFKVNIPNHKVYAHLDGKKTWRVFENLISNALKYSMPNTRVYIDLVDYNGKITMTIKNISSYEMNFNVEEIFERFKRGDASRNTEGSGLGLAIAKSILELQGGKLNIEIDGDLFKAIVEI